MALQRIQFAKHSYQDRSLPVSAQRVVNLYLEPKPPGSLAADVLHGTPGLTLFSTCGSGPVRGIIGMGSYAYVVSGLGLYRVDSGGTATLVNTVTGTRPVAMAHNGTQVAIVSDSDIYYATDTDFGQVTSLSNCVGAAFQDGYVLYAERNTQKFYVSAINDLTTIDPLDFALANATPDNCTGIVNVNRETWVFGEQSIQVYYNSGNVDFPFSRIAAGVIQRGCKASRTIAEYQGTVLWLGDDRRVYRSQGYQPVPISTYAIERQIAGYASPDDAVAYVYTQEGHTFYVLTFAEGTWVYDLTTNLWHERQSDGLAYWRAHVHSEHFGRQLVGDSENGNVYALDLDTYTENGAVIRRIAAAPPLHAETRRSFMRQFRLDVETGVGLASGQGSDPQVMMRFSDDGGRTWSNELWRDLGEQGKRKTQVHWDRLGSFRNRTLEVQISDPVKVAIIDAYVDVEVGT